MTNLVLHVTFCFSPFLAKKAKQERKADNLDQAPPSAGMVSKSSKHGSDRGTPKAKSKKGR